MTDREKVYKIAYQTATIYESFNPYEFYDVWEDMETAVDCIMQQLMKNPHAIIEELNEFKTLTDDLEMLETVETLIEEIEEE